MPFCMFCGTELSAGSFCVHCGKKRIDSEQRDDDASSAYLGIAGSFALVVAIVLFGIFGYTIYSFNLTLDQAAITSHIDSPPSIPWRAQAGVEFIVASVFLIAAIALISRDKKRL